MLKLKIDKVTVIRVTKYAKWTWPIFIFLPGILNLVSVVERKSSEPSRIRQCVGQLTNESDTMALKFGVRCTCPPTVVALSVGPTNDESHEHIDDIRKSRIQDIARALR